MAQTKVGALKMAAGRAGISVGEYIARSESGLKRCIKCQAWKPKTLFCRDGSRSDGLASRCTRCNSTRTDLMPTRIERANRLAVGLKWCSGCRGWLPAANVTRGSCRAHKNAKERQNYADDPHFRAYRRGRSSARRRNVDPVPLVGKELRLEEFNGECAYCPCPATTWDHIHPVSRGGRTVPRNIAPACGPCNSSKRTRELWEWLETSGRLAVLPVQKGEFLGFLEDGALM